MSLLLATAVLICTLAAWAQEQPSLEELIQRAEQGDAGAQHALGGMYLNGLGVQQDVEAAFWWIGLSAGQGDANAQNGLGGMYLTGLGVQQDVEAAFWWIRLSAGQGNAGAQYNLGVMYANGDGLPRDDAEAVR